MKKIVEEREYAMVGTRRHAHNTQRAVLSPPPPSLAELDSDQRKQLLSSQAWWRLERGDMCRFPASSLKTGIKDYSGATEEETEWKEIILFIEAVLVCLSRPEAR